MDSGWLLPSRLWRQLSSQPPPQPGRLAHAHIAVRARSALRKGPELFPQRLPAGAGASRCAAPMRSPPRYHCRSPEPSEVRRQSMDLAGAPGHAAARQQELHPGGNSIGGRPARSPPARADSQHPGQVQSEKVAQDRSERHPHDGGTAQRSAGIAQSVIGGRVELLPTVVRTNPTADPARIPIPTPYTRVQLSALIRYAGYHVAESENRSRGAEPRRTQSAAVLGLRFFCANRFRKSPRHLPNVLDMAGRLSCRNRHSEKAYRQQIECLRAEQSGHGASGQKAGQKRVNVALSWVTPRLTKIGKKLLIILRIF